MIHDIRRMLIPCLISTLFLNSLTLNSSAIPYVKKTMYDTLTEKEINMLEVTIQHEVGGLSKTYKTLVAEIIYNRIISDAFPNSVEDVLFQEGQFCGIDQWYSPGYEIDSETEAVVKEVFSKDKADHEAVYYYNPALADHQSVLWFEYSGDVTFIFEHSETSWGVTYKTRFFK